MTAVTSLCDSVGVGVGVALGIRRSFRTFYQHYADGNEDIVLFIIIGSWEVGHPDVLKPKTHRLQ